MRWRIYLRDVKTQKHKKSTRAIRLIYKQLESRRWFSAYLRNLRWNLRHPTRSAADGRNEPVRAVMTSILDIHEHKHDGIWWSFLLRVCSFFSLLPTSAPKEKSASAGLTKKWDLILLKVLSLRFPRCSHANISTHTHTHIPPHSSTNCHPLTVIQYSLAVSYSLLFPCYTTGSRLWRQEIALLRRLALTQSLFYLV